MSSQEQISAENSKNNTKEDVLDIRAELSAVKTSLGKNLIMHGANQEYFDGLQGKEVGQIRKKLREVMNIPGDANAYVQQMGVGSPQIVNDDYTLQQGDTLEFTKEAGTKGTTEEFEFAVKITLPDKYSKIMAKKVLEALIDAGLDTVEDWDESEDIVQITSDEEFDFEIT